MEVHKAVCDAGLGRLKHQFLDPSYFALPQSVWDDYIAWDRTEQARYELSRYDCKDFAICFIATLSKKLRINAAGLVLDYSGMHAYNCLLVLDENGELKARPFEPQGDRYVKVGDALSSTESYKAEEGMVLWP